MTIVKLEMTIIKLEATAIKPEGNIFDGDALIHLTNPSCAANKKGADSLFAPQSRYRQAPITGRRQRAAPIRARLCQRRSVKKIGGFRLERRLH